MEDIEIIRQREREQAYQHLLAIRKIAEYKRHRDGADKAVGELLVSGFFQFSFKDAIGTFECWPKRLERRQSPEDLFEEDAKVEVDLFGTDVHAENRDIVRHLLALRKIRNARCGRCSGMAYGNCLGCGLSGREYFNTAAGLKLMMLYDWKAIYEVVGIDGYFDETDEFVYKFQDCLGAEEEIEPAKPELETKY
jgi:hypothetical protein